MESPYVVWACLRGLKDLSEGQETNLKHYFSSSSSGGGEITAFEKEDCTDGILLRIEYKEPHVVEGLLEKNHDLPSIIGFDFRGMDTGGFQLVLGKTKPCLRLMTGFDASSDLPKSEEEETEISVPLNSSNLINPEIPGERNLSSTADLTRDVNASDAFSQQERFSDKADQLAESDEENISHSLTLDSANSKTKNVVDPFLLSRPELKCEVKSDGNSEQEKSTKKVVVEVYEFPDKPVEALCEEICSHFAIEPFDAVVLTQPDEMFDEKSKTFKLEFSEPDAKKILEKEVQDLLGDENEKIKLRLLEPPKSCAVLLRFEAKVVSDKVIKAEMKKFGEVKDIIKMDDTSMKFLLIFNKHEAAVKASNAGINKIGGKQVSLSVWSEPLANLLAESEKEKIHSCTSLGSANSTPVHLNLFSSPEPKRGENTDVCSKQETPTKEASIITDLGLQISTKIEQNLLSIPELKREDSSACSQPEMSTYKANELIECDEEKIQNCEAMDSANSRPVEQGLISSAQQQSEESGGTCIIEGQSVGKVSHLAESDGEKIQSWISRSSENSASQTIQEEQNLLSPPEPKTAVSNNSCSQHDKSTNRVVVEVYEYPDKPQDQLLEELVYHFLMEPFLATSFTSPEEMFDEKLKTFKLEFSESDADNILESEKQNLLGIESEQIRLRPFEPPKPCAVSLTCEAKLSSDRVIRTEMNKFGDVKDVRKMDDTSQKFLVIFYKHEAAVKASNTGAVVISGKKASLSLWNEPFANQLAESDEEKIHSCEDLDSVNSTPVVQNLLSTPEHIKTVSSDSCPQQDNSTKRVVVEVYEYPDKPMDQLVDELEYHFSKEPFLATSFTRREDMFDEKLKTFKLEFTESDAAKVVEIEKQYLLGDESEKIRLRLFELPKSCAVLLTCEAKFASDRVIRIEMNKYGDVKDVRKMDDTNQKFLVVFNKHEDALKACNTGVATISCKQVSLSLWSEPLERSEPVSSSSTPPEVPEYKTNKVLVSCGDLNSPKVVENKLKSFGKIQKFEKYEDTNTFLVEFSEPADAYKVAAEGTVMCGKKSLRITLYEEKPSNTVVVEVFEFPNKPLEELQNELAYHFTCEPLCTKPITKEEDMYDKKSNTFKLEFSESDAKRILESELQDLLGEESEKIRLRRFELPKSCAVLLSCETTIASAKVIKTEMKKFGDIEDVRKIDETSQKFLVIFTMHEDAVKASNTGSVTISGKKVSLSLYNEPLELSESSSSPSTLSTFKVSEFKANKVLVSCEEINSPEVVADAMKSIGRITRCEEFDEPYTFLVEFTEAADASKAVAKGIVKCGKKNLKVTLYGERLSSTGIVNKDSYKATEETVIEDKGSSLKSNIGKEKPTSRDDHHELNTEVSKSSIILVSNLSDVDSKLLAHWIKTLTGLWPLSCHLNNRKEKAIVWMPSIVDASKISLASEEEYFLHGNILSVSLLQPTTKMLAKINKDMDREHLDALRLYFNSPQCGLRNGKVESLEPFDKNQRVFVLTFSEHKAIEDIMQKVIHSLMGYTIEVGEFYPAAGICTSGDYSVFHPRKCRDVSSKNLTRLLVYNVSCNEKSHLELLMKNQNKSRGDRSAKIDYKDNMAYIIYEDPKVTNAVFKMSRQDGIFLNDKRLEMDLETTELTSIHDFKAVRLSGLPHDIDPDRLKFFLSDISENFVTFMLFQENGDRAVAHFKDSLDMLLLFGNYQTTKLEGCIEMRIQPELKSTSVLVSGLHPNFNQNLLVLIIEDILPSSPSAKVEPVKDKESSWIVSVSDKDIDILRSELSKRKEVRVSNYSEFLGSKVTNGVHRKTLLLSDIVKDQFLLQFLLDNQLSGFNTILDLTQKYGCNLSDDGKITMRFDSEEYTVSSNKFKELKAIITSNIENYWCVDKSITLTKENADELSGMLSSSENNVRISRHGENLIIVGESKKVQEIVSRVSQSLNQIEERKREERETRREVLKFKEHEIAYLEIIEILNDLQGRFKVKELSLDKNNSCLIIHASNQYFNEIKKAITDITSSLCESTVSKSEIFIKKCENRFARERILDSFKEQKVVAVCVPGRNKLIAYAKTKQMAQTALKCIDGVVWEVVYPVQRTFNEEEKKLLQQSKHLWEVTKNEIISKDSSVDINDTLDTNRFLVTGCGKGNHTLVINEITEFFNRNLQNSVTFKGKARHITYMSRYMRSDLEMIEQTTKATISCKINEICLSGTKEQTSKAEQQLHSLYDRITSGKHKVEVDYHIQFLLSEPEIIEDLGKACNTLVVLENGESFRNFALEPRKEKDSLVLQINITPRTTLQVKKAEIHEIHDCDGLAIPTSRKLQLSDLNDSFAKYIKEKGGAEIFNECINSPEAVRSGRTLLPGSILTTSAGEFRELRRIIHMVQGDWSRSDSIIALEKCFKSTFLSAKQQGLMALLIPMSSFPENSDHNLVIRSIIKTIKTVEDDLPPRLVLLETRTAEINDLTTLINEELKNVRHDPDPAPASSSNLGFEPQNNAPKSISESLSSNNQLQKLSGTQLLIGGCKFTLTKGLLQDSKQEAVINSTGESISLQDNPLAKALSDAAGPELQEECTMLKPLKEGQVKVSNAYNLKCKKVLHCRIKGHYTSIQSEKDLIGLATECLRVVDQQLQFNSVAFPALGTGKLNYPAPVVANCLVEALKEYTSKNTVKFLREVVIVIFPNDIKTYEAFFDTIGKGLWQTQHQVTQVTQVPQQEDKPKKQKSTKKGAKESKEIFPAAVSLCLNTTKIAVHHGDILQYTGKAIVCPSNKQIGMGGFIADQLMKDSHIRKQISNADKQEILSDGVCVVRTDRDTVEIPNYNAEYIFLVDSTYKSDFLLKACLQKCQQNNIESIAFPFIGTGRGSSGEPDIKKARKLLTAANQFAESDSDGALKKIDFIISEQPLFQIFVAALNEPKEQSLWGRIGKGAQKLLNFFGPNSDVESRNPAAANYNPRPTPELPSKSQYEDSTALHITIYGAEEADIQATIKKLNERLEKETAVIQWDALESYEEDRPLMDSLSKEQVETLRDEAKRMRVNFEFDQDLCNIQITGYKSAVYQYRDLVKNELLQVERSILDRKLGEFQSSNIFWAYCEEHTVQYRNFYWEDSHHLETINKGNPNAVVKFKSKEFKERIKVDLHLRTFKFKGNRYSIKRIDKTSGFPDGWDESAGEHTEVNISSSSNEYHKIEANFKKSINNANATVLEIRRVQHLTAYNQYIEQRRKVAKKLNMQEDQVEKVTLWHSLQEGSLNSTTKSFFNRSHTGQTEAKYGKGCYFTRDACMAISEKNASKGLCVCQTRVIVGEYTLGTDGMIDCPAKPDGTPFDSAVDDVKDPKVFVVFHDAAAYPEYIINFKF